MDRLGMHIKTNTERILISLALMVFVLLTSCPVKSGIKTLAGMPVNTTQGLPNKQHLFSTTGAERCGNCQTAEISLTQASSVDVNRLLPVILLSAFCAFLLGTAFPKASVHPFYGRQKLIAPIPLFLRQRKLII